MKIRTLVVLSAFSLGAPAKGFARVASPTLAALCRKAETVVLAQVESVASTAAGDRVATSQVIEVWKPGNGVEGDSVQYRASPAFACDLSTATVGRYAVLFLARELKDGPLTIADAGRGQMEIQSTEESSVAVLEGVVLPNELESFDQRQPREPGRALLPVQVLKSYVLRSVARRAQ